MQKQAIGRQVLDRTITSLQAVETCIERIEKLDGEIRSFVSLRTDQALAEARKIAAGGDNDKVGAVRFSTGKEEPR